MKWQSEEIRSKHYSLAKLDPWDQRVLEIAEEIGDYLEDGMDWKKFEPQEIVEVDQLGLAIVIVLSNSTIYNFWDLLSPVERIFVGPYIIAQINFNQELAAKESHKHDADATLSDLES